MQFLKNLFRKKEEPETTITIEGIGTFNWDDESEYWLGTHKGSQVSISYDGLSQPTDELAQSVIKTLKSPCFIENKIIEIKELAKEQYPIEKHSEIASLKPKDIVFQNPDFILIQFFGPENNEPFWFAEVHGSEIYVGCDT